MKKKSSSERLSLTMKMYSHSSNAFTEHDSKNTKNFRNMRI